MPNFFAVGVDVFVISKGIPKIPEALGALKLEMISERGMKVWPGPIPDGIITDWFRCRYVGADALGDEEIAILLKEISKTVKWEKVQKLFRENGRDTFSKAYE